MWWGEGTYVQVRRQLAGVSYSFRHPRGLRGIKPECLDLVVPSEPCALTDLVSPVASPLSLETASVLLSSLGHSSDGSWFLVSVYDLKFLCVPLSRCSWFSTHPKALILTQLPLRTASHPEACWQQGVRAWGHERQLLTAPQSSLDE